jgi:hypothetical protein
MIISKNKIAVKLSTSEGLINVYFNENSGKICTRGKIDTITDVLHPGIIIGEDIYNREWVVHNHYSFGKPMFEILENYSKGQIINWDNRNINYSPKDIVARAISEQIKRKPYNPISYNCQTFVNIIVQGKASSEAINKITDRVMIAGAILSGIGLLTKNKSLIQSGVAAITIAGATQIMSR